jgi:hypothetical protein
MKNETLDNLIRNELHRDGNGNLYGGIVISPTLNLTKDEVIAYFLNNGIDIYANENYELLKAIGLYTYSPTWGGNHCDGDFRMFYTPWYGN